MTAVRTSLPTDDGTVDFDHIKGGDATPYDLDHDMCRSELDGRLACTRAAGHRGLHIATGLGTVYGVKPQPAQAVSPDALVREHDALRAATAPVDPGKRVNEALCNAAVLHGGDQTLAMFQLGINTVLASGPKTHPLHRLLDAALWHASLTRAEDLLAALTEVEAAWSDFEDDATVPHDGIACWRGRTPTGECETCTGVARDRLFSALQAVHVLLGDAVMRALTEAAA